MCVQGMREWGLDNDRMVLRMWENQDVEKQSRKGIGEIKVFIKVFNDKFFNLLKISKV